MTITFTNPPTLPSLSDPANFNDRALGLFSWLTGTFIPELEAVEGLVPDGGDFAVDGVTFYVDVSTNNVGFGTSSPSAPIDVSGSGDVRVEIESTSSGDVSLDLFRTGANSYRLVNDAGVFRIQHGATPAGVDTNDRFTILNTGFVGIGDSNPTEALNVTGNVVASGRIRSKDGTIGDVGIGFGTDQNTGLIRPANDTISIVTASTQNLTVNASGNVGIGNTNPGTKLVVFDDSTTTSTSFRATNASYTGAVNVTQTARTANTAFSFYTATSDISGSPDTEFRLRGDGNAFADGTWTGGGADYAEYFEWADGNPDSEDRVGISVVLDGTEIRAAVDGEEPIGVISGNPSVVGDGDIDRWKQKYLRDDFGRYIWEDYDVLTWTEDDKDVSYNADSVPDDVVVPDDAQTVVQQRRKLNPDFDPDMEYISRENRPEWDTVGLMGKLRILKGQPTGSRWLKMRDVSANVEEWLVR